MKKQTDDIDLLNAIRLSKEAVMYRRIRAFAEESNNIEGIDDQDAHEDAFQRLQKFLKHDKLTIENVCEFNTAGKLRDKVGMDVCVGDYRPLPGGDIVPEMMAVVIFDVRLSRQPHAVHIDFEKLHPFMDGNGRTGRAIWLWQMVNQQGYDISLGFLHKFYYQTLSNAR